MYTQNRNLKQMRKYSIEELMVFWTHEYVCLTLEAAGLGTPDSNMTQSTVQSTDDKSQHRDLDML